MSLRGLGEEGRFYLREHRVLFVTFGVALIGLSLITLYFLLRERPEDVPQAEEPTEQHLEEEHSQEVLEQLLQLREEARQMQEELEAQRVRPSEQPTPRPAPVRGPTHVEVRPGEAFRSISPADESVYIPSGSVFRARLLMPVKTGIQETFVMAQTTHEYRMDSRRRIPRSTRLIGSARLNPMLRSVVVRFNKMVTPQGIEHPVNILALSHELFPELEGIYFTNELETYSSIMAFGFLGGFAEASRPRDRTIFGREATQDLTGNLLHGASTASFRVMEEMIQDIRRRAVEFVIVPAGEPIFLVFEQRFVVPDKGLNGRRHR